MHVERVRSVLEALEREHVRYVICGDVAMNLLGLARATEDLDLFVEPDHENIERLKAALRSVFSHPCIEDIRADDLLGEYPAVRYVPPEGDFYVDILMRLGERHRDDEIRAQRVRFRGVTVSVATPESLYRMKKDTVRPKDWGDAAALKRIFGLEDD